MTIEVLENETFSKYFPNTTRYIEGLIKDQVHNYFITLWGIANKLNSKFSGLKALTLQEVNHSKKLFFQKSCLLEILR